MTVAPANLTDRELLLLIHQQVSAIHVRMDRTEQRLEAGSARFADHDRRLEKLDRDIADARSDLSRAVVPTAQLADATAKKFDGVNVRVERLEEAIMIDGDDGKPVSLREVVIREQRERLKWTRIVAAAATLAPVAAITIDRLLKAWGL